MIKKKSQNIFYISFILAMSILCIVLSVLLFLNPSKKTSHSSQNHYQKPKQTTPYIITNGKLPTPKGFFDYKVSGTLTYQNAMQIANNKFEKQDYESSIIWAYRAYKIAPKNKDAWILYAKNLNEMGYKKQAIEILKYYKKHIQ